MRKILCLLIVIPVLAFAQKNSTPVNDNTLLLQITRTTDVVSYDRIQFELANMEMSVQKRCEELLEMSHPQSKLKLTSSIKSRVGMHLFYQQYMNDIPVYGSYIKVNLNTNGEQLSAFNHLYPSQNWSIPSVSFDKTKGEPVYIVKDEALIPAYKTVKNGIEFITGVNDAYLFERDLRLHYSNDDTIVKAMVFLPDPLTTAGVVYGQDGTYKNFNDSDYALLNDERVEVSFPATFRDSFFYQENEYCIMLDMYPPAIAPITSATPDFSFTRKEDGFKEAMVMFHISNTQEYIRSLGFNNLVNYQLKVDAHAGMNDNSYFQCNPDTFIYFGIGGVPDAEDADVIVHEYTHAISYSSNPTGVLTTERHALDEGISDVMATTYSRYYNEYNWRWAYNWDGHNEYWNGRNAGSDKTYADKIGDYYSDSEIWSSTIDDIAEDIGRDATITLLLTSQYSYTPSTTMPEAATLFMQADSLVYNKYNSWRIGKYFNQRGLGNFSTGVDDIETASSFHVINTAGFANGSGNLTVEFAVPSSIMVYNLNGQKVYEALKASSVLLSPSQFERGFYFMTIENGAGVKTIKFTRF